MKYLKASLIVLLIALSGCNSNQHIWDELERCKERYKEECSVVVIPVSKYGEIKRLSVKWDNM